MDFSLACVDRQLTHKEVNSYSEKVPRASSTSWRLVLLLAFTAHIWGWML